MFVIVKLSISLSFMYDRVDLCPYYHRSKPHRETAISVQQMLTSQRAMKHAAWGACKDIRARIRAMKREGNLSDKLGGTPLIRTTEDVINQALQIICTLYILTGHFINH